MRTGIIACLIGAPLAVGFAWLVGPAFRDPWNTVPISRFDAEHPLVAAAANAEKPQIIVLGPHVKGNDPEHFLVFEAVLVNPMTIPISYCGGTANSSPRPPVGEISPEFRQSRMRAGVWENEFGTARWAHEWTTTTATFVRPREAGRFKGWLGIDPVPTRIGFDCTWLDDQGKEITETIWSQAFPGEGE